MPARITLKNITYAIFNSVYVEDCLGSEAVGLRLSIIWRCTMIENADSYEVRSVSWRSASID